MEKRGWEEGEEGEGGGRGKKNWEGGKKENFAPTKPREERRETRGGGVKGGGERPTPCPPPHK